ncbi:MAG: hypothetical protein EXR99_04160 [Gemmataceae bacterium]|nr:hypothetical protein [Gemmataceae bacterium]
MKTLLASFFLPFLPFLSLAQPGNPPLAVTRLTTDGAFKSHLQWSADGKKLLFTRIHQGRMELSAMEALPGAKAIPLIVPSPNTPHFDGHWSPDSALVVYVHDTLQGTDGKLQINTVQADGVGVKTLVPHKAFDESPRFSPDGKSIAWVSTRDGNQEIYSLEMASGKINRLTQNPAFDNNCSWKGDGKKIAFASSRSGNFEICSMNQNGDQVLRLTNHPALDCWPVFSPDGKSIAFTSNRTGNYDIFLMQENGENPRNLTSHPGQDNFASFSPDGKRLAFISNRDGGFDIYTLRLQE